MDEDIRNTTKNKTVPIFSELYFLIQNQSYVTNTTQCNKVSGSPFPQYISTINNKKENELASHGTGRVHNALSQNDDSQYFETPWKTNFISPTKNNYKPK